jgi:preprotein translocase SecE subunit
MSLPLASLLGAVYVVAAVVVAFYALPTLWVENVVRPNEDNRLLANASRWAVELAAFLGLVWFGRTLLGDTAPKGVRGGVFLVLVWAAVIFLAWRWVALNFESNFGLISSYVFAAFLVFLAFRFLTGRTGTGWMVALEEQGWFSTASYKRSLGLRVRRLTQLGILIVCGTGIYTLATGGAISGPLALALPFENPNSVKLAENGNDTVVGLLAILTLWVAWRAVNVPTFGEFLIATEAEMNKVSWTPRKRLAQDTVVVLTTTLLLALFLLVVDLFWSNLLSWSYVGVLPQKKEGQQQATQRARW